MTPSSAEAQADKTIRAVVAIVRFSKQHGVDTTELFNHHREVTNLLGQDLVEGMRGVLDRLKAMEPADGRELLISVYESAIEDIERYFLNVALKTFENAADTSTMLAIPKNARGN